MFDNEQPSGNLCKYFWLSIVQDDACLDSMEKITQDLKNMLPTSNSLPEPMTNHLALMPLARQLNNQQARVGEAIHPLRCC